MSTLRFEVRSEGEDQMPSLKPLKNSLRLQAVILSLGPRLLLDEEDRFLYSATDGDQTHYLDC
jgi:hypothetical protein